ncbi:MAG TPA: hypothetical protein VF003_00640 [Pseudonocardiaceae bacterium]
MAVDPTSGDVYLPEDAAGPNGLFYRWQAPPQLRPDRPGALRTLSPTAGTHAAMSCTDGAGAHVDDLSRATEIDTSYAVRWVQIPDRDARTTSTRNQLGDHEITRGHQLEGCWWGNNGTYVISSFARAETPIQHDGQIWFFDPHRRRSLCGCGSGSTPALARTARWTGRTTSASRLRWSVSGRGWSRCTAPVRRH